ncbi:MAG: electron transport complex protein RnfC [Pseudohongiellaceae bacterium]|jgi:electron transport complex protein RnfC
MSWLGRLLTSNSDIFTVSTPGGIKPRRFKSSSLRSRIMASPLPKQLLLALLQHDGLYLTPTIAVGDKVKKYQLIAQPSSEFGLPMYAPTSGVVTELKRSQDTVNTALLVTSIIIETDGLDSECVASPMIDLLTATPPMLIAALQKLSVGGLGGGGFPAPLKLQAAFEVGIDTLLINAAECEPFISCDEALLREHAVEVVAGSLILQKASAAANCIIAIQSHKTEAIAAVRKALAQTDVKLAIVATKYPAGSEKQLIQAVTNKQVPAGGKPTDIGVLVQNAGTAYSTQQSITSGRPNISRITTVSGKPLRTPKNFDVLYGTPVSFLLEICGVDKSIHSHTVIGGPLMGVPLENDNEGVSRATNSIIAADVDTFPATEPEQACIRCGYCADACPVKLLPQQLYSFARSQNAEQLVAYQLNDCIECGACSYVCPSKIPLVDYFKAGKATLTEEARKQAQSAHWQTRFQAHQIRLKIEKNAAGSKRQAKTLKSPDKVALAPMSREAARSDIAAAVARVRKKKNKFNAAKEND